MLDAIESWFAARGWRPFDFQRACWEAQRAGRSGLVHAPTGIGKTQAAWMGTLLEAADAGELEGPGLRALWITPLRALARDTADALAAPLPDLGIPWRVELRTGDTPTSRKARQRTAPPQALVTTPESLTILLSYPDGPELFRKLRCVVVDEWHELLSTKRGVQTELALARLRAISPGVRAWGLSATLANVDEAARTLVDVGPEPAIIRGVAPKRVEVETLLPDDATRYPWAGHLGLSLLDSVLERLDRARTTLVFTNTRSQAEIWFAAILRRRPDMLGRVALHHGSLDRDIREEVERLVRADRTEDSPLRCVVCTSSLDLGVDFAPVDQVIQVGSPKGAARLIQRAGRSGHRPGAVSRVVCVPSHAFELVEFAAAREAIDAERLEQRPALDKPFDVLVQHLVTLAAGGGFDEERALAEVRSTHAYRGLTGREWTWAMDFVRRGGPALTAYPDYARIAQRDDATWHVASNPIERRHRVTIGTITADSAVAVRFVSGRTLGSIEESFVARLRVGDRFVFAGRVLELVRLREMTAQVRVAKQKSGAVPRWGGGKMPLSSQLADGVRKLVERARDGRYESAEMEAVRPLLERQRAASRLPAADEMLVELTRTREGHHAFLFPFAGRLAHEGLGAVLAWRLTQRAPTTVRASATDYGIELFGDDPIDLDERTIRDLFRVERLADDLIEALNATELARRQFREIARVAGLTFQGFPGQRSPGRHLQASSDMFYDVFREFDADNLLLSQAQREVVEGHLEFRRLRDAMARAQRERIVIERPETLTPMAFPIWAETLRSTHATTESWETRVRKMAVMLDERPVAGAHDG